MKFNRFLLSIALALSMMVTAYPESAEEKGTELSEINDSQPKFERVMADIGFFIYGSDGRLKFKKKIKIGQYTSNMGTEKQIEHSISYFMEPADDRGNAYMAFNYKNRPDVKYVYLKGLRKAKKVAGASKRSSFFGSDFYNEDMGYPDIKYYKFKYIGKEKIKFKGKLFECDAVESIPVSDKVKSELGYGRRVSYFYRVNKRSMLTLRLEYYDENLSLLKVLSLKSFLAKKNIRGVMVFYTTGLEMKNVQKGTRTELKFTNLKFEKNARVRTDIFSVKYLTRKWWQ